MKIYDALKLLLNLSDKEIKLFFSILNKECSTVEEAAKLYDKDKSVIQKLIIKLYKKRLVRRIPKPCKRGRCYVYCPIKKDKLKKLLLSKLKKIEKIINTY